MKILNILLPVFLLVLLGFAYGRRVKPDMEVVNKLVLQIFVPALVFSVISARDFNLLAYGWLLLAGVVVIAGSGLLAWACAAWFKLPARAFVPTMMFNNCGNLGLPLAVLAFGDAALEGALVLFLVSNLGHFTFGIFLFGGALSWRGLLSTPVNLAIIGGLGVNFSGLVLPVPLQQSVAMLGEVVIPLMLFALGVRMVSVQFEHWKVGLIGGLVGPLSSLLVALLILPWWPLDRFQLGLLVLFAALPPAVLNFLFSEQYQQQPNMVASMVLSGNALSVFILSAVLWWLV